MTVPDGIILYSDVSEAVSVTQTLSEYLFPNGDSNEVEKEEFETIF